MLMIVLVLLTCITFIIHSTASTQTNQTTKSSASREIYSRGFQRYYTAANDVTSVKVTTVEAYSAPHCISLCVMNQDTCESRVGLDNEPIFRIRLKIFLNIGIEFYKN